MAEETNEETRRTQRTQRWARCASLVPHNPIHPSAQTPNIPQSCPSKPPPLLVLIDSGCAELIGVRTSCLRAA
ncbi:uncharacterized [Tachysurus ichikawai]